MSAEILAAKAALRQEIRTKGRSTTPAERAEASLALCAKMTTSPVWQAARSILFYSPMPDEPDVRPLLTAALESGTTVLLPRYDTGLQAYTAALIKNPALDCVQGKFGIVEPSVHCQPFNLMQLDLVLVPGVCFDASGHRLGRGKGFYDRLLTQVSGVKCGVAFEWQVVSEVPAEPHDVCLNCILTPIRWLKS